MSKRTCPFFFFPLPTPWKILLSSELVSVSNRVGTRKVPPGADQGVHTAEEENNEYSLTCLLVAHWFRSEQERTVVNIFRSCVSIPSIYSLHIKCVRVCVCSCTPTSESTTKSCMCEASNGVPIHSLHPTTFGLTSLAQGGILTECHVNLPLPPSYDDVTTRGNCFLEKICHESVSRQLIIVPSRFELKLRGA